GNALSFRPERMEARLVISFCLNREYEGDDDDDDDDGKKVAPAAALYLSFYIVQIKMVIVSGNTSPLRPFKVEARPIISFCSNREFECDDDDDDDGAKVAPAA
ncbi:hypothetical protein H5410_037651, partial [Solanum commersonii]